jgi:hypothetical protein
MSENIKEGVAYLHMVAQGRPDEVAWSAAWIDRAYHHLVKNRMGGAEAYAQAVSMFAANSRDLDQTSPEEVIFFVLQKGFEAQEIFPKLDPSQPEASRVLQYRPEGQGKPS